MPDKVKILFVCTANVCRSFMAERICMKKLEERGRNDIMVSSAGVFNMGGAPGDPVAGLILEEAGFDGDHHQSRYLTEDIIAAADMILVMERRHKEEILMTAETAERKTFLLKPFSQGYRQSDGNDNEDIRDPYRLSLFHYRTCFAEICLAVDGLLQCI